MRDLTAPALESFADEVLSAHDVGLVVCNAGATHGIGAFLDATLEKALQLVRLNCLAPLVFAHKALADGAAAVPGSSWSRRCPACAARD